MSLHDTSMHSTNAFELDVGCQRTFRTIFIEKNVSKKRFPKRTLFSHWTIERSLDAPVLFYMRRRLLTIWWIDAAAERVFRFFVSLWSFQMDRWNSSLSSFVVDPRREVQHSKISRAFSSLSRTDVRVIGLSVNKRLSHVEHSRQHRRWSAAASLTSAFGTRFGVSWKISLIVLSRSTIFLDRSAFKPLFVNVTWRSKPIREHFRLDRDQHSLSKYWQFERQTNTIDRLVLTVPSNDGWPRRMFRGSCLI